MLISHKHKFVFFHLPKAAGSSVEYALRKYSHIPYSRLYNYMIDYLGEQRLLNLYERHIRPRDLKKINPSLFRNNYIKFCIVRNTWDWHCSQFHFHKSTPKTIFHDELRGLDFSQYIEWACREENIMRANSRQKQYISDFDGTLLVEKILHFEQLDNDFQEFCSELGLKAHLPNKNKSFRKKDYRDLYSEEDKNKIALSHEEDIKFFGFVF